MKLNTRIPAGLKRHYLEEIEFYREALKDGRLADAWKHLENAHILGQSYPLEHTSVHWLMLKFGIRIKKRNEVIGQLPRLLVGGVKSFVGVIPMGNTGGADVPALQPMEIASPLKEILQQYKVL